MVARAKGVPGTENARRDKKELSGAVVAEVITGTAEFGALENEWEDLHDHAPLATPFQSWAWLYSWWEQYGDGYELRLVIVRDGTGLLVGVLPMMLERKFGFGRLLFIGTGLTDYLDVIARESWEQEVCETGMRALREIRSWRIMDLQEIRPQAAAWHIYKEWPNSWQTCVRQEGCPIIEIKPWEKMLASLSRNHRSTFRRALRRAETDGVRCKQAEASDAEEAAQRLVLLHRESWQGRDVVPEHLSVRFEAHLKAAARRMSACKIGAIREFWRGGEVVISDFMVFGHDFVGTYMLGASQEALKKYQWNSLYIWDAVNTAEERSATKVDLLRGEDAYKLRWNPEVVPNHRLLLGKGPFLWELYAGYYVLRSRARGYAYSEDAPRWIRTTTERCRTLRRRAVRRANKEAARQ